MNICQFGNAAWGFRNLELSEQLKITHSMGLHIHELGIANAPLDLSLDADKNALDSVKALYQKYDIQLLCAATGNDFSCASDQDAEKVKRVTDLCAYLGIRYLRIFAGFSAANEVCGARWDQMVCALNQCAEYAKERGVTLAVETHGGVNSFPGGEVEHFMSVTTDENMLARLKSELNPSITFLYDPANLYAVGEKHPNKIYRLLENRVSYVHLKDFKTMPSGHKKPAACGESDMDWGEILCGLRNFKGVMLFEYEIPENLEAGLIKSYQYIKKELETCLK